MARARPAEAVLLLPSVGLLASGLTAIGLVRDLSAVSIPNVVMGFTAVYVVAHLLLVMKASDADQLLLPCIATLTALGMIVIARVRTTDLTRQLTWLVVGVALFALAVLAPAIPVWLRRYRYSLALAGIGLLVFTAVFGIDPNDSGVRIWVGYGGFLFQPAEVVKVLMVAFLAAYLDERREILAMGVYRVGRVVLPPLPYLVPSAIMLGLSLALFVFQHDLGVTFLFFGVFVSMLYLVSGRGLYLVGSLLLLGACSYVLYLMFRVARTRIDLWINPWSDPQDNGFQIVQALVAFASGGVIGSGLGLGAPGLIPASYTDFPFAVIAEELGLVGGIALIAIYVVLMLRGYRLSIIAGDGFRGLLAFGFVNTLSLQALIILAGNLKLVPLTGVTLPFVSLGGSSLVTNFFVVGMLLRLSSDAVGGKRWNAG